MAYNIMKQRYNFVCNKGILHRKFYVNGLGF